MHGVGTSFGAVTFVNALFTGVGAAAGVTLPVEAAVDLEPVERGPPTVELAPGTDTPLVRSMLLESLRRYGGDTELSARLQVRSEVPVAKGLKSSSAVATAIGLAVANALDRHVVAAEVAGLAADVAQTIGLSATGAFDDALASVLPDVHVTDNTSRRLIRTVAVDREWDVVLWIPRTAHLPSPAWATRFRALEREGLAAAESAAGGDLVAAMTRNTELAERVLGLSYRPLREELRRQGAVASGVSGLGPTLAVVVPAGRVSEVRAALPRGEAEVLAASFVRTGPSVGSGRG